MAKDISYTPNPELPLFVIYGPGRSGTTWLGSIINSHPDITYRFEAFRGKTSVPRIKTLWEIIQTNQVSKQELQQHLYNCLLPAHPLTDKPPFFHKSNTRLLGHKLVWNCARKFPLMSGVCEQLYTPKGKPPIVFKEVRWRMVKKLLDSLHLRSVFVLRGPQGTISSRLRGQRAGLMPTWQRDNLQQVIETNKPSLIDELPNSLNTLNDIQKNAVLWRVEAECVFDYLQQYPKHMLVLYEDLCMRPLEIAREVFDHFEIPWHQQTENFITQSTSNKPSLRNHEKGIKPYFSVTRNTIEMVARWTKELTEKEQTDIQEIVAPSKAYQLFCQKGL